MTLRDIPGYEGFYAVNDTGQVFRTQWHGKPICRPVALRQKRGYLVAHLCRGGVRKDQPAHRAVWLAFRGPIPDSIEINHMNGRRDDNRLANLELVTKSGNALHKFRVNGYRKRAAPSLGERNGSAKLTADDVRTIRKFGAEGVSQKEIGKRFNVSQVMAGRIIRRQNWAHVTD